MRFYTFVLFAFGTLALSGGVFVVTAESVSAHSGGAVHIGEEKHEEEVEGGVEVASAVKIAQRTTGTPNRSYTESDESQLITGRPICEGTGSDRRCFFLPGPAGAWGWESYRNRDRGSNTSWQHFAFDIYEGTRVHNNPGIPTGSNIDFRANNNYAGRYDTGVFALYKGTITGASYGGGACGGVINVEYKNVSFNSETTTITQRLCHMQEKVHVKQDGSFINANDITTSNRNSESYKFIEIKDLSGKNINAGDLIGYVRRNRWLHTSPWIQIIYIVTAILHTDLFK